MRAMWARGLGMAWLAVAACNGPVGVKALDRDEGGDEGDTSESGAASTAGDGGTTVAAIPIRWPNADGDESDESSSSGGGVVFLIEPDVPPIWYECDIWKQDCGPNAKCMWIVDAYGNWRGTRCKPILGEPAAPGEPCTILGGRWSGIDSCDVGSVCWQVDYVTLEGTCVALCTGSEQHPMCEDPQDECKFSNDWYAVCVPRCDPLEQDCPAGQACYPIQEDWSCAPDASGEAGGYGDACEFINVCDPGYICLDSSAVPAGEDCEGAAGCCTAVCDLGDPLGDAQCEGAAGGQTCQSWYEEGAAPPGYEDVGACALPS